MSDLIDPLNAPEIFFDGVHEIKIIEGVVRIALYTKQDASRVAAARLAIPVSELPDVIQTLVSSLASAAGAMVHPNETGMSH